LKGPEVNIERVRGQHREVTWRVNELKEPESFPFLT